MENVGFIGLRASSSLASHLYELVNSNILDVEVPWLKGYLTGKASSYFAPPLAKVLATSAPVQAKKNNQKKRKVDKKEGSNKKEEEGRKKLRKKNEAEGKE
jgi:ribonuclease P/MRP protein subunit POP3